MLLLTGCKKDYVSGPIDEEAKREAENYWASSFSKCGDSFYGVYSKTGKIVAFKNSVKHGLKDGQVVECGICALTNPQTDGKTFTEADRLNGLEWVGETSVLFSVYRIYEGHGVWSEWYDYAGVVFHSSTSVNMRKIRGRWQFGNVGEDTGRFRGIHCSEVPQ